MILTSSPGVRLRMLSSSQTVAVSRLCPDLLTLDDLGAADGWRGRCVRAFFWLLRFWS